MAEAPDRDVAYFAGLLEGKLTGSLMYQQWQNTMAGFCTTPSLFCSRLEQFLKSNAEYIQQQIEDKGNSSAYWYQVCVRVGVGVCMDADAGVCMDMDLCSTIVFV